MDTILDTASPAKGGGPRLDRATFRTKRLLDFATEKELTAQTGHGIDMWPQVVVKELIDNAIDECEEAGVPPDISLVIDADGITVTDNGRGIPASTIVGVLDFEVRASSRDVYVSPTRGAQGNALKTLVSMPFVLDGSVGVVEIGARGIRHRIEFRVDQIRQEPVINHTDSPDTNCKNGTMVKIHWPSSASYFVEQSKGEILQLVDGFVWLNPHLSLRFDCHGERECDFKATDPTWKKWSPSDPTSAHWYSLTQFTRLIGSYLTLDRESGVPRTVRELVEEFRGLTGSKKPKAVVDSIGLSRATLESLVVNGEVDRHVAARLLEAMKSHSREVKPEALGIIGRDHFARRMFDAGYDVATLEHKVVKDLSFGVPSITEVAFAALPGPLNFVRRKLITGANWSPGLDDLFRNIAYGGLGPKLQPLFVGEDEPIGLVVHVAQPGIEFDGRGKSAIIFPNRHRKEAERAVA